VWVDAYLAAKRDGSCEKLVALAERIAREHPDRWQPPWAEALCVWNLGRTVEAGALNRQALALARTAKDPIGIALAGYRVGWSAVQAGNLTEAEAVFRESLAAARTTKRQDLEGHSLNGLAGTLLDLGVREPIDELYDEAIDAFEAAGLPQQARIVRFNKSENQYQLGQLEPARRTLSQLYPQSVESGDEELRVLVAVTLGNTYFIGGEYEKAREWYDKLPAEAVEQRAMAEFNWGRKALSEGDLAEARRHFTSASRQEKHRIVALEAEAFLGLIEHRASRGNTGRATLERVIREADAGGSAEPAWVARWLLGRTCLEDGRFGEAADVLDQAVRRIEKESGALDTFTEGLRFLRDRSEPYVDLTAAIVARGLSDVASPAATRVLDVVERTHARALRSALQGRQGELARADLAALQKQLGADEVLLDYLMGDERGVVVAIRHDRFLAVAIAGRRKLERALERYLSALRRPLHSADARRDPEHDLERSLHAGIELREALVDPVRPVLDGVRRILVVPETALALLPFAGLPWDEAPARFLGQAFEIGVLPLAGSVSRGPASYEPMLLGGDPEPDAAGEFPALPLARTELDLISGIWGHREIARLTRGELTSAALLRQPLDRVRSIHLATHAIASTADPGGCAVYLSHGERLGVSQILELKLEASPLVTLSACRTGEGELVPGEGVVGLGWAFLRAGASAVVVSLWSVEDTATSELMVAFHRALHDGLDPIAALASAQREIAATRFHPAYWAPFVIVLRPRTSS
jgi:CHAT domain-containing protein